ncbi:DUF4252 domain-containing protein [Nonlabens ponticola]|uniref:DUF4252 domain-containing protein n=1 Tax=Nonlabens ponticola TaxID=2496866 RepID=A0A3S9MYD1_9FLAO|nr:DUF4252 domain-containing protein [Nonlabens ponticola]AZQ44157.1 DUF4252 domain-containing protein [Nonlabens ponticola]
MKNLLYIATFILAGMTATAQNFNKVGNLPKVSETYITGEMFKMISGIDSEDPEFNELMKSVGNLTELRVYTTQNASSAIQMKKFTDDFVTTSKMPLLMSVKEGNQKFTFHARKGSSDSKVKNLVMFIEGMDNNMADSVLLVISGDIDLNQIAKITEKMDVPGQRQIEKATKGN